MTPEHAIVLNALERGIYDTKELSRLSGLKGSRVAQIKNEYAIRLRKENQENLANNGNISKMAVNIASTHKTMQSHIKFLKATVGQLEGIQANATIGSGDYYKATREIRTINKEIREIEGFDLVREIQKDELRRSMKEPKGKTAAKPKPIDTRERAGKLPPPF